MQYKYTDYCSRCKAKDVPLIKNNKRVYKDLTTQYHFCRDCANKRTKEYYSRNKEKFRAIIYKSIRKHAHKQEARTKLNLAIKSGKVIKPDTCSNCGITGRIQGHHHDYEKPLEVTWLCSGCHADEDKLMTP